MYAMLRECSAWLDVRDTTRSVAEVGIEDGDGRISQTHSISTGLDNPGVGPDHAYLKVADKLGVKT